MSAVARVRLPFRGNALPDTHWLPEQLPAETLAELMGFLTLLRSPDGAERNPGPPIHCTPTPDCAPLHPGYGPRACRASATCATSAAFNRPFRRPAGPAAKIEGLRMRYRCAVLDDYQNVARTLADWGKIAADVDVKVFTKPMSGPDEVHQTLKDFDIVCMMRERTPFRRNTIEALPKLKLLITTGARNASIDMAAAAERGITVCGTGSYGNPTTGITFGLILELTRRIGYEHARLKARRAVAGHARARHRGQDARRHRARQARPARRRRRQGVRHEGDRVEPEPDG